MLRKVKGASADFFYGKCKIKNKLGITERQKEESKRKG
jgi:hypothetical protein